MLRAIPARISAGEYAGIAGMIHDPGGELGPKLAKPDASFART